MVLLCRFVVCLVLGFLWFDFCDLRHECGLGGFVCSAAYWCCGLLVLGWFGFEFDVFLLFEPGFCGLCCGVAGLLVCVFWVVFWVTFWWIWVFWI